MGCYFSYHIKMSHDVTPQNQPEDASSIWIVLVLGHDQEKAMATHSSTLVWKIPRTEEPGRLQSMGSLRVKHDWATSFSLFTFMHWRRKWQPTPVFLPGESQGWGSLVGCCLWGRTELDMTEVMQQQQQQQALRYYIYNFFSFLILFINYLNSSLCEINFPQAFLQ